VATPTAPLKARPRSPSHRRRHQPASARRVCFGLIFVYAADLLTHIAVADDGDGDEETPTKKAKPSARKVKSRSATPAKTKVTPPAETIEEGETEAKEEEEPNEAGAMMDDMNGTD
jgi:hypothetical protein